MQRWIVLGAVAIVLMLGGGAFVLHVYKQNRPHPVWVPLPINPEVPGDKRKEIAKDLKAKLNQPEILIQVCKELGLAKKWEMASDQAASAELSMRLFVKVGETASAMGSVPSINVGVSGKVKEKEDSEAISLRLMKDVWKILGIKPPQQKEP
jgi:hypothetical protein